MNHKFLVKLLVILGISLIVLVGLIRGFLSLTDVTRDTIITAPPDTELRPTRAPEYRPLTPAADENGEPDGDAP